MNKVKRLCFVAAIFVSTVSPLSKSLGLGNATVQGTLNRPLSIELPLIVETPDLHNIQAYLANEQQHQRFGLSYPAWMPELDFNLIEAETGSFLKITSVRAIKEPIVNFIVVVKRGQFILLKEVTLFLDPADMPAANTFNSDLNHHLITEQANQSSSANEKQKESKTPQAYSGLQSSLRVKSGQSLWRIARAWKLDGYRLNQKMQMIFINNPRAFINGNKNKLIQGAMLHFSSEVFVAPQQLVAPPAAPPVPQFSDKRLNVEQELTKLNATVEQQRAVNQQLKLKLVYLQQQLELQQQIKLAQASINQSIQPPAPTNSLQAEPPSKLVEQPIIASMVDKPTKTKFLPPATLESFANSGFIKLAIFWFSCFLGLAYLGIFLNGRKKARAFANKLDHILQDIAYNEDRQESQMPSIKELLIPDKLTTALRIKYLNTAANFYLRSRRYDLAKELINDALVQFCGNRRIIKELNKIWKKTFIQLDADLHSDIMVKLDSRALAQEIDGLRAIEKEFSIQELNTDEFSVEELESTEFDSEWFKLWNRKVS